MTRAQAIRQAMVEFHERFATPVERILCVPEKCSPDPGARLDAREVCERFTLCSIKCWCPTYELDAYRPAPLASSFRALQSVSR